MISVLRKAALILAAARLCKSFNYRDLRLTRSGKGFATVPATADMCGGSEANTMKKILGVVALGLLFSIPAHGQNKGSVVSAGSGPNGFPTTGGGGGIGGGAAGGGARANLPAYGRARFATAAYSGNSTFAPSSFLSFDQAVELGKRELAAQKSVVQVAAESLATMKAKSRVAFTQDDGGNVVPLPR